MTNEQKERLRDVIGIGLERAREVGDETIALLRTAASPATRDELLARIASIEAETLAAKQATATARQRCAETSKALARDDYEVLVGKTMWERGMARPQALVVLESAEGVRCTGG